MAEYVTRYHPQTEIIIPELPVSPAEAWAGLSELVRERSAKGSVGILGSSLGGFYATALCEHFGCRAVLINPAVYPYELLKDYIGEQTNPYTGERFTVKPEYMDELRSLAVPWLKHPQQLWLLQQTGDEVLDYRQALDRYRFSRSTIEMGGDHSFTEFERYPAQILRFLQG